MNTGAVQIAKDPTRDAYAALLHRNRRSGMIHESKCGCAIVPIIPPKLDPAEMLGVLVTVASPNPISTSAPILIWLCAITCGMIRRADFGKLMIEETEKWAKVVKFSGAKAD